LKTAYEVHNETKGQENKFLNGLNKKMLGEALVFSHALSFV